MSVDQSTEVQKRIPISASLPIDWKVTSLAEVTEVIMGQSPSSKYYNTDGVGLPFFQGKAEFGDVYPKVKKWCSKPNKIAKKDDVLLSVRAPVGPTNLSSADCCIGRGLAALRPKNGTSNKYVLYYLRSIENDIESLGTGTTFKAISGKVLREIPIPVAPTDQQEIIVAEIEKQFSRLDEAVTSLKRAKANLKRYKAAVLKAAVEGKLTEEWRKQHPDVEPASELLKRILAERRRKWEEAKLAKMRANGKEPKDDKWKKKYEELTEPDIKDLPIIPSSWSWATPAQLASHENYSLAIGPFGSNLKVSDYRDFGVPLVFVKNIRSGSFDTKKYISFAKAEGLKAHMIHGGEILITKMGEPPGDACLYPPILQAAIITADCIKWQLAPELEIDYFVYVINSRIVKTQIQNITKGVAQLKMSLARFKTIAVPLPPNEEQNAAFIEIESRLSATNWAEDSIESDLKRADSLRQSILTKAFSGRLEGD